MADLDGLLAGEVAVAPVLGEMRTALGAMLSLAQSGFVSGLEWRQRRAEYGDVREKLIQHVRGFGAFDLSEVLPAESVVEPVAEPPVEPSAEPVVEPIAEPVVEGVAEPVVEPVAKPPVEPPVEPAAEPVVKRPVKTAAKRPRRRQTSGSTRKSSKRKS